MTTAFQTKKSNKALLKSVKNNVKKTLTVNDEGNYVIIKVNDKTGELISTNTLNSDLFDIQQVVEYFSNF